MAISAVDLDHFRRQKAAELPAGCQSDFLRLTKTLIHGPPFQWLLVDAPHEGLRKQVMAAIDQVLSVAGLQVNRLPLSLRVSDVAGLEARLVKNAAQADVVHVVGSPGWFTQQRWDAFNVRRERIATSARARLVFWLDPQSIALASQGAPDLWAWRSGVYGFNVELATTSASAPVEASAAALVKAYVPNQHRPDSQADNASLPQLDDRIAAIHAWLETHPDAPDELRVAPLDELGRRLVSLGELDAAMRHLREVELPLHERRGSDRDAAIIQGRIADIHQTRGQYDEALRIRRELELPAIERAGDVRARAITQGKIADILQARGQFDEALTIRRHEELPVFEQLSDPRARAITQSKIADILGERGQLDEAMDIYARDVLPVFVRLDDHLAQAIAMGRIADIFVERGQWDQALRIYRDDVLPVCERLGNLRERAVTQSKIANVLEQRGQTDEAMRILLSDVLPAFERLGDAVGLANTQWRLGQQHAARGEVAAARAYLEQALPGLRAMGLPQAGQLADELAQLSQSEPERGL